VLEHVRNVQEALRECHRVLKQAGKLFAVFPPFYQPLESHLGQATQMPALQWVFSGPVLTRAHHDVCNEVGNACRKSQLESWERLPTLNGITVRRFRELIKRDWTVSYWGTDPILSDGRRARRPLFRALRWAFVLPARLPFLEELFLGRICCVLEKA
jgi:SAM-dependent methyltransferase